jgi:lipopolysaccharide transport system ATP-binding protein
MLFVAVDLDPAWRGRKRPLGRYVSTGWIPGNFFAEGLLSIVAVIMTISPDAAHAIVEDAVAFRVVDSLASRDTSRGDFTRPMPGLLRPMLKWHTRRVEQGEQISPDTREPWAEEAALPPSPG